MNGAVVAGPLAGRAGARSGFKGHVELPGGGHETCPGTDTGSTRWRTPNLPGDCTIRPVANPGTAALLQRTSLSAVASGSGWGCARSVRATISSQLTPPAGAELWPWIPIALAPGKTHPRKTSWTTRPARWPLRSQHRAEVGPLRGQPWRVEWTDQPDRPLATSLAACWPQGRSPHRREA